VTTTVAPQILEKLFSNDTPKRYELIDGELQAKPMVIIFHSLTMTWLGRLLSERTERLTDQELWVLTDPLARIREDHWRRPDIAVIRAEDAEPWKYVMPGHWPMLCIEILSPPDQMIDELFDKCKLFHEQGTAYCWVIAPESRAAWVYHKGAEPRWIPAHGALDAGPLLIKLNDLWRGLKNKRGNRTE
jgi:Uma2 family endonuclease